jgi:phosphohistidine swiveling domain-containing protein
LGFGEDGSQEGFLIRWNNMVKGQIKWVKLLERNAEPLILYQIAVGRKWYPETLGVDFRPQNIKCEDNWYYLDADEMEQEINAYKDLYKKDPDLLDQMADRIYQIGGKLVATSQLVSQNSSNKDNKQLCESFTEYNIALEKFVPAVWAIIVMEKFLTTNLIDKLKENFSDKDELTLNQYFAILTTLSEKSSAIKEYENLLTIAIDYKRDNLNPKVKKEIQKIYNGFNYLGAVRVGWTYLSEPYDVEHYETVVRNLANENPEKELLELRKKQKESKRTYRDFVKRRDLKKELIREAKLLQKYISLRTYRGEFVVRAMIFAKELLREIAFRLEVTLDDVSCLTPDEIVESIQKEKIPDINFGLRKENFLLEVTENKPVIAIKDKKDKEQNGTAIQEFSGNIAQSGKIQGEIKIVRSSVDAIDFKKGQILVSPMTSPDMIMAIRKAGAIITDEGGITCHASIVSREFKIPCIIGTRIATKTLKDGDLVEVDAEKGLVKILEKAK